MTQKVLVGLSGGVDSAVSAYLLMQQGYQVIAGFMKNYADEQNPHCHTRQDRDMALQVAQYLGIETCIIFDFRAQYRQTIIDYIIRGYASGITPNPDVLCNSEIKFKLFLEHALDLACDYIATGHYAQIVSDPDPQSTILHLMRGFDHHKDQTYFLAGLNQDQLAHSLFPLGALHKSQVRQIAKDIGLPNADRPDSQGLCFIGDVPIRQFLKQYLPSNPGAIKDLQGKVLGHHDGAYQYTIGQRHGLGLNTQQYVIHIDTQANEVIVGPYDSGDRRSSACLVHDLHRIAQPHPLPYHTSAKIRYRQEAFPVVLEQDPQGGYCCRFEDPQTGVAPGQILVLYQGEECVASAVITASVSSSTC